MARARRGGSRKARGGFFGKAKKKFQKLKEKAKKAAKAVSKALKKIEKSTGLKPSDIAARNGKQKLAKQFKKLGHGRSRRHKKKRGGVRMSRHRSRLSPGIVSGIMPVGPLIMPAHARVARGKGFFKSLARGFKKAFKLPGKVLKVAAKGVRSLEKATGIKPSTVLLASGRPSAAAAAAALGHGRITMDPLGRRVGAARMG